MVLIDLKCVEFISYVGVLYLIMFIIMNLKKVVEVLQWVVKEMDMWYDDFVLFGFCYIDDFNCVVCVGEVEVFVGSEWVFKFYLYFFVVVDEFVDFMMVVLCDVEDLIVCIMQFVCVFGIYLVLVIQ